MARASLSGSPSELRRLLRRARSVAWSHQVSFGLRCDLAALPEIARARIPIVMESVHGPFAGFAAEATTASGDNRREALLRDRMQAVGIERLYVASSEGRPAYAQWLITAENQERIHRFSPGLYPRLAQDEALLEGAYTFLAFRRSGAMADGMMQLLRVARDEGLRSVLTFVSADYGASIRGCARVGFDLDVLRLDGRVFGRRRTAFAPVDAKAAEAWRASAYR